MSVTIAWKMERNSAFVGLAILVCMSHVTAVGIRACAGNFQIASHCLLKIRFTKLNNVSYVYSQRTAIELRHRTSAGNQVQFKTSREGKRRCERRYG